MKRFCLLLCGLVLFIGTVFSGPFGLSKGMTLQELQTIEPSITLVDPSTPYIYVMKSVPIPSSRFESYLVQVHPEKGLFGIVALGVDIKTTPNGTALINAYNSLVKVITDTYPAIKPNSIDFLVSASTNDKPEDFMMSLEKSERFVHSYWGDSEAFPVVNKEIDTITLLILTSNTNVGYLRLSYEFTDFQKIKDSLKEKEQF